MWSVSRRRWAVWQSLLLSGLIAAPAGWGGAARAQAAPAASHLTLGFRAQPDTALAAGPTWTVSATTDGSAGSGPLVLVLPTVYDGHPAFFVGADLPPAAVSVDGVAARGVRVESVGLPPAAGHAPHSRPRSLQLPPGALPAGVSEAAAIVITPQPGRPAPPRRAVTVVVSAPASFGNPPAGTVPVAFGLSGPGHGRFGSTEVTFLTASRSGQVIICCGGGGGGGGGGSSGPPVQVTQTSVWGWEGQPLNYAGSPNVQTNIPSLGGLPLGTAQGGTTSSETPTDGNVVLGSVLFGTGGVSTDQTVGVAYPSPAPAGVTADVEVTAVVTSQNLVSGILGVGGACGQTNVNWFAPTTASTDTLSTCSSSYQFSVPIPLGAFESTMASDVEQMAEEEGTSFQELEAGNAEYADLIEQAAEYHEVSGALEAFHIDEAIQKLAGLYTASLSEPVKVSTFTWNGAVSGGQTYDFSVDPQVQAAGAGLGTEINIINSNVMIAITEQYTENSYAFTFPAEEVGAALISPWLQNDGALVTGSSVEVSGGALPPGLSVGRDSQGYVVLTGTPTGAGAYAFSLTVGNVDGTGNAGVFQCTLIVAPALQMTQSAATVVVEQNVAPAAQRSTVPVSVQGGLGGVSWYVSGNQYLTGVYAPLSDTPPGVVPAAGYSWSTLPAGQYQFNVQASDGLASATAGPFTLDLVPHLHLLTTALPGAEQAVNYQAALQTSGGVTPFRWSVISGSLPPGLSLSPYGQITGTPATGTAGQTYDFSIEVGDGYGGYAIRSYSLAVSEAPLQITTTQFVFLFNEPYSASLGAQGGAPPYRWSLTGGSLPPGLSLSSSGVISGTPTSVGSWTADVEVTDSAGHHSTAAVTITVKTPPHGVV